MINVELDGNDTDPECYELGDSGCSFCTTNAYRNEVHVDAELNEEEKDFKRELLTQDISGDKNLAI